MKIAIAEPFHFAGSAPGNSQIPEASTPIEYLTFRLGAREYGINIRSVQEVRTYMPLEISEHLTGCTRMVSKFRGLTIPVADLRPEQSTPSASCAEPPVEIVAKVSSGIIGLVVDDAIDVVTMAHKDVALTSQVSDFDQQSFCFSVGCVPDADRARRVILVDPKVTSHDDSVSFKENSWN